MKNMTNVISAMTVVIGLAASASISADSINSVIPQVESNGVSSQSQFAPITIQDVIERAQAESVADVRVNSESVSVVNEVKSIEDILGSPAKL